MEPGAPHVLLVESEPATRHFLEQSLRAAGWVVATTRDGESGLALIAQCQRVGALRTDTDRFRAAGTDLLAHARSHRRRHVAPPCPGCGSDRVIPIVNGAACTGLLSAYATGRVALGGARKSADVPTWQCRDCDCRWGP